MRRLYVYILSNRSRGLYVGVTNDIVRRLREHRRLRRGHTGRYRIGRLVYVETVEGPRAAIAREKQIKGWRRSKKVELIQQRNPAWNDLAEGWARVGNCRSFAEPALSEANGLRMTAVRRSG